MSTDMGLGIVHASDQTGHQHPAQRPSCYPVQLNSKAVVWAPFMMVLSQDTRVLFEGCHIHLVSGQSVESREQHGLLAETC